MDIRVMVIDDETDFLKTVQRVLSVAHVASVQIESDPRSAADFFQRGGTADVALIDVTMPGLSGIELLAIIKEYSPATECIMMTAVNDARTAMDCIRQGAYDYLVKPVEREDLLLAVNRALERKRLIDIADIGKSHALPRLKNPEAFAAFNTRSPNMQRLLREAELHAASDAPVLLTGETGTGKELLARAMHRTSQRAGAAFTPVNMAAITATLFDAEFFGHTRGAFTGAEKERAGYLEHSHGGTVFLDEIGTLSIDLQGKLLRVLQEQEYYKIGSSTPSRADVRFIAATNVDLEQMTAKNAFRRDLYYRLKYAWLHLPPLRERRDDIALLVNAFLQEFGKAGHDVTVDDDAMALLIQYDYPGNVRELRACMQAMLNLADGGRITPSLLPEAMRKARASTGKVRLTGDRRVVALAEVERAHILSVFSESGNNKVKTAEQLGIGLSTLRRKLSSYGIE